MEKQTIRNSWIDYLKMTKLLQLLHVLE